MKSLTTPLKQLEVLEKALEKLNKETGVSLLSGCIDSQKTHLAYGLGESFSKKLIVTYNELKAKEILEEYKIFGKEVYLYPAKDFLFFHADIQGGLLEEQRILALQALVEQEQVTIITTIDGCMGKVRPLQTIQNQILTIDMESIVELDALKVLLSDMGYERAGQVEAKGQFAIRGGIIDIFPLTEEVPVRIELWDEEVDSIRSFDAESQRSIENLDCVKIYPAKEPDAVKMGESISFLEYFANKNSVVFLDEPHRLAEKANAVEKEFCESWRIYGISSELIHFAYEKCIEKTAKLSFPYINKILLSWHQKGIKTVAEASAENKPKTEENKPSFDLDELERRMMLDDSVI
jgi:transcription-repair coupling factor (superfamily II helicase)